MKPQMPAVCSASGKHRGLTPYKHGVVAWKSDHSKGKTLCQAFLFLHRQLGGKESPHRVPKTSHGGFVRHKADCHGAMLVSQRSAREEVFLWVFGTCPSEDAWDTSLRHSKAPGSPRLRKLLRDLSCPPPRAGAWVPGVPENQDCIFSYL